MENQMKQLNLFLFILSISTIATINKPPTQVVVRENIPVVITKPITHVAKMETIVSKKETHESCLQDAKCNLLAEAIVYEARGEPDIGKVAVAQVILNRVKDSRWPNKIVDVIKQPHQFSYLKDKHKQSKPTADDWNIARKIAYNTIFGYINSPVGNATHYHAARIQPKWAKKLQPVAKIGNHVFYR